MAHDLGGEVPEKCLGRRGTPGGSGSRAGAQAPRRDERVVMVVRERQERGVPLHRNLGVVAAITLDIPFLLATLYPTRQPRGGDHPGVHYGLSVANTPPFDEPRNVVRLAEAAETAGWRALLLWDHLAWAAGTPASDPWVALSACTQATERLLLGTGLTPLPRRRPQIVAHTLATLDRLSGGRVVFAAGLGGDPREFAAFGEETSPRRRAAMLDEALDLVAELLAGRPVDHRGPLYTASNVTLEPPPEHRIPIWIGGSSHAALRRAARWDGWLADAVSGERISKTPHDIGGAVQTIRSHRATRQPFDVAVIGYSDQTDTLTYADAGATWWLEAIYGRRGSLAELLAHVDRGPPARR